MLLYILCQFFSLLGLYPLSNLLNLAMMVTFMLMATWGYSKYSGNLSEIGTSIDNLATTIWESGLAPAFNKVAEEGTQFAARKAVQRLNSTTSTPSSSSVAMSVKKRR